MRVKGQRGGAKRCLNEGTEVLRDQEGRLTKCGDTETRFRQLLVTNREAAFSGPGGAHILSQEGDNVPLWSLHKVCY